MASFGDLLLRARGINNPRNAAVAALLDGAGGVATPTAPAPGAATAPGAPAPGAGVATPPQPQAYQSPPDLLDLYSQLTDYDTRSRRIDTGLGLLGSAFAQPQNRQMVYNAFAGGSGQESAGDTLSMITQISDMRSKEAAAQAAAEKERKTREMLPAISDSTGIPLETLTMLYETDGLDEALQDQVKVREAPKIETQVIDDKATGRQFLINKANGEKIATYDTGLAPSADPTTMFTDAATGKTYLIRKEDGSIIKEYPTAAALTNEQKLYQQSVADGFEGTLEDWLDKDANRKKPVTNITTNVDNTGKLNAALVGEADKRLVNGDYDTANGALATINSVTNAQRALNAPGGIIAGSKFSQAEYEVRKGLADIFGITDQQVVNSANFDSAMGQVVLDKVKQLGTGNSISNADRDYTKQIVGASNEVPPEAMPKILSIMEFGSRNEIIKYNKRVEARLEASKDKDGNVDPNVAAALQKIPVPEVSDDWMGFVPEEDLAAIKTELAKGPLSEEDKAQIDKLYGPNAADAIVERIEGGYGA